MASSSSSSLIIHLSLFTLVCIISFSSAQTNNNNGRISPGATITAGDANSPPWRSPSGDFAFGFLNDNNKHFLLSIWYDKIQDETIVWHANTSDAIPSGSVLRLDSDSGLILRDPTNQSLWFSAGVQAGGVGYAFLNNTGNLVLVASDNTTTGYAWESFKNPTDTMLPTQELDVGGMLISRRSSTDFSQGRFYLRMRVDGNLILSTKAAPGNSDFDADYYNSQTSEASNASLSGYKAVLDERGSAYVLTRDGRRDFISSQSQSVPLSSENFYRLTLDFDGVLTLYSHPRSGGGGGGWSSVWSQPDNICLRITGDKGSGACGFNSVCRLREGQRPVCDCPTGYALLDPNDQYGSCRPNFTQGCDEGGGGGSEGYDFVTIVDTDWPLSDFEQLNPSTEENCREACLSDCFCAVAIYRSNSCWKKKLPLSNGRIDTSLDSKAFLKYLKSEAPRVGPDDRVPGGAKRGSDREGVIVVGSVLLGGSVFVNVLFVVASCLGFFFIYRRRTVGAKAVETNLRCFSFKELEQATNKFKEELGQGAFGIVYKGEVFLGSMTRIAVKKLDRVAEDTEREFRTEVSVIGQTHHKNLVRLIGFCDEGQHRLLVYEYMSNGSLASFLFNGGGLRPSWSQRIKIAQGVARGLAYLHEECITQIIHCDIKPQNILLDNYYTARISDFGMAKLLMINQSRTNTGIRGTKGYVAPEWFRNSKINAKVDVYSFGVLLLEIISCQKSLGDWDEECGDRLVLTDWAWDCFVGGTLSDVVGDDAEALEDQKLLERFVMVSLWCIQEDSSSRPTMREVCQMLEGVVEVDVPPRPTFSVTE